MQTLFGGVLALHLVPPPLPRGWPLFPDCVGAGDETRLELRRPNLSLLPHPPGSRCCRCSRPHRPIHHHPRPCL